MSVVGRRLGGLRAGMSVVGRRLGGLKTGMSVVGRRLGGLRAGMSVVRRQKVGQTAKPVWIVSSGNWTPIIQTEATLFHHWTVLAATVMKCLSVADTALFRCVRRCRIFEPRGWKLFGVFISKVSIVRLLPQSYVLQWRTGKIYN